MMSKVVRGAGRVFAMLAVGAVAAAHGQALPGTRLLVATGDPARQMVDGLTRYLGRLLIDSKSGRRPERAKLRMALGVVERRVAALAPELVSRLDLSSTRAQTSAWRALAVRWVVFEGIHGEGLLYQPVHPTGCAVVAVPDAGTPPERLSSAQVLASAGCEVLVPLLIDRDDAYSGSKLLNKWTNQTHREWIYRMAFPVGRTVLGYEVQKVLAGVDWLSNRTGTGRIGVYGEGEGGAVALFAAALDERILAAQSSGYFQEREDRMWREPIYREVFGLLKDLGDAEVAALVAPRRLILSAEHASLAETAVVRPGRSGAAPGRLMPVNSESFNREIARARESAPGDWLTEDSRPGALLEALGIAEREPVLSAIAPSGEAERMERQVREMEKYTQELVARSESVRDRLWSETGPPGVRERLEREVIGELPGMPSDPAVRSRLSYDAKAWSGYEVMLEVRDDVAAYGVLLMPKGLMPGEKRPLVFVQHGLQGRPEMLFNATEGRPLTVYRNIGAQLAELGYIVFVPQMPFTGDFRHLSRMAHPLGLSLFSVVRAQYQQTVDWLVTLPNVNARKIGFYGLSYGGKTALRVPTLDERFLVAVCGGDFNEWIQKLTSTREQNSYLFTEEFEVLEWNLASVASHAEMAKLMAPRGFLVERGHEDGVGRDEWVAYEFAKVRRYYVGAGWGDRVGIAFFQGPHRVDGPAAIAFLRRFLDR